MHKGGGLITADDLAHYEVKEREPVRGTYRGYEIISAPPPSSGGTVLIERLQQDRRHHLLLQASPLDLVFDLVPDVGYCVVLQQDQGKKELGSHKSWYCTCEREKLKETTEMSRCM